MILRIEGKHFLTCVNIPHNNQVFIFKGCTHQPAVYRPVKVRNDSFAFHSVFWLNLEVLLLLFKSIVDCVNFRLLITSRRNFTLICLTFLGGRSVFRGSLGACLTRILLVGCLILLVHLQQLVLNKVFIQIHMVCLVWRKVVNIDIGLVKRWFLIICIVVGVFVIDAKTPDDHFRKHI